MTELKHKDYAEWKSKNGRVQDCSFTSRTNELKLLVMYDTTKYYEDRLVRRVLSECVLATPASIFSDVPNLDKSWSIENATDRKMWEDLLPSKRASLIGE